MLNWLLRKLNRRAYNKGLEVGLKKRFQLARLLRESDRTGKGFIIGSKADRELSEILKKNGI